MIQRERPISWSSSESLHRPHPFPFSFFISSLSFSILYCSIALPCSADPTLSHTHTNPTNPTNMLAVSRTLTLSAQTLSDWVPFHSWTLSNSLSPSHTHTYTPSGRNPAVCGCSSLDMPDRLLWGGRWAWELVCKNLFLIHSVILVLMWANVAATLHPGGLCGGLFGRFIH